MPAERPLVVYWNNQPSPYVVDRFNAVADRGEVDLVAWFDGRREPDRSWDVDEAGWRFEHHYLDARRFVGRQLAIPDADLWCPTPDLLVTSLDRPSGVFGAVLGRAKARRLALRTLPSFRSWEGRAPLLRATRHAFYRIVDGSKVAGADAAAYAASYGLPRDRQWPVTQSIDVGHYARALTMDPAERAGRRKALGLTGCAFVYAGRLWRGKGLDFLLAAFDQLRRRLGDSVSLLLVGEGEERQRLERRAGPGTGIVFAGFVQPRDLPEWYALSDVFVFPTLGDPNGVVVAEAMAAGLPVVATDAAGDIRQRVERPGAGLVVPAADAGALAGAMERLACDPELRQQHRRQAIEAAQTYVLGAYAADFGAFVAGILATAPRRTPLALACREAGRLAGALTVGRPARPAPIEE